MKSQNAASVMNKIVHIYFSMRRMGIRPAAAWRFAMRKQ
jgi:hypothetical protein